MTANYKHVSIPDKLSDEIEAYLKRHPQLDLRSKAQLVNFALRKLFVEELGSATA